MFFEALNTQTGQRITLSGSRWAGLRVTIEQAQEMVSGLTCLNSQCGRGVKVHHTKGYGVGFLHKDRGPDCEWDFSWQLGFETWVRTDILGSTPHAPFGFVPAGLTQTKSGVPVAVRPLSKYTDSRGFKEHTMDAQNQYGSMWLADANGFSLDFKFASGFVTSRLRQAVASTGCPVSVGILSDNSVRFVGDVAFTLDAEGKDRLQIVSLTEKVSVEALRYWCQRAAHLAPTELQTEIAILDAVAARRIQPVANVPG